MAEQNKYEKDLSEKTPSETDFFRTVDINGGSFIETFENVSEAIREYSVITDTEFEALETILGL